MKGFYLLLLVLLLGCDPMDDRMVFINSYAKDIHVEFVFGLEGQQEDWEFVRAGFRQMESYDTLVFGMTSTWEVEFRKGLPDTTLGVVAIPIDGSYLFNPDSVPFYIQDTTLVKFISEFKYSELVQANWHLELTSDGKINGQKAR